MAFAEGSPDELFLSDGEYQALGEQFCVHYIEEGRADEEAVALVCEHLQDPKWKMDITHKVKSTEEVTNAAVAALQDHDADRIDEVIGMIAEYADAPRDFYGHLLAMYPELDLSGVEAAVDGVDARAQLIESCKADGSQLDSFLRRFFARFVPWDGADREDKAKELCTQYFFKGTWDELHSLLKEHYPRALELNELQVIKMNGSVPDNAGTHTPASFVNTESASKSAQQEARSVAPPPSEPVPAVPAAPMEPKKRIPVLRLTRLQWLQHNAFIAKYFLMHKNENVLKRFAREMVISIGFRVYFALFYLLPGAWFLLVYSVHFFYALTWRLFLPEDTGYIQTLGLFCIFVAAAFAAASLWTHLVKTLLQWIYLDDAAFFGDVDYAVRWKDKDMRPRHRDANVPEGVGYDPEDAHGPARPLLNPVPQVHRATLPPHQRITFFGLPTSDSWSREYYCLVMGVATVLSPFLYCIIATAVKKESAYQTLSHFVEWCVVGGVAVHILLWIFAWGFTIRAKYRAYYEWSTFHNGPFESDDALLPELALDLPTAARNTVFVVVLIIPVGIIFLITSRVDPKYPVEWIFTWIAGVAYLLIMREMATDVRRFPLFIIFSAAAFCILGVVATALLNVGALAVFLVVTFMSQCLLVPHRYRPALKVNKQEFLDQASEGLTQALCEQQKRSGAGNASASVGAGGMSPNAPTEPMDNSAPPAAAAATNGELHGATVHIVTDAILRRQLEKSAPRGVDRSLLPCERVLRALCMPILSCVCPSSAFEGKNFDPSAPRELRGKGAAMPAGFWRLPSAFYGDAPDGASRHPRRKVMLQAAPRAMLSFAAAFFVSVALVLALAGYLRQAGTVQAPAAPPVPVDTASNFTSPVCSLLWSGLSVVDLAVLAETGYLRSTVDFERNYAGALQEAGWGLYGSSQHPFNASKQGPVPLRHGSLEKWGENSSTEVDWLHYATLPEDFAAANSTAEKKTANASGLTNWTNVHHVVVLRSNLEGRNLKRDLDVWGDSVAYQVVSALVPVLRVLPVVAVADWVEGLATFKRPLDGGAHPTRYLSNLHAYILNVTDTHPGPVTLVGHATNGGLAAILGAKLGLPVVAFSPPGTAYLAAKMGLKAEPNPRQLSVVPAEDQMCAIDEQAGAVQHIPCTASDEKTCHAIANTITHLATACRSPGLLARLGNATPAVTAAPTP
eukprot:TRINITY_DN20158_c0_g1_i1.p1 TRINITY_DN20158_c0_g1~~TRINITY_DN20158_c0_g1_i1.p1  ORF type:complete len:1190 (+),score=321.05 TRINITY_DN20158_c0_g1_i1:92-3661(+)